MSKRNSRGFTLIEFMIVLCIIGILAAIAVPNFIAMRNRAKDAETNMNMRMLQLAAEDYGVQNDGAYATSDSLVVEMLPSRSYDPVTKCMRNAVTRKFSEPSTHPAPGAIIYTSDGVRYFIHGYDHRGEPLTLVLGSSN
jgi:prepilin-type N-terminal cleavage/methylation domain-containing protein